MPSAPILPAETFSLVEQRLVHRAQVPLYAEICLVDKSQIAVGRENPRSRAVNLAIDSKLRGRDLVSLKVGDVAHNGYASSRATVPPREAGQPVRFEITEQSGQTVDAYLRAELKLPASVWFITAVVGLLPTAAPQLQASIRIRNE